ncbi:PmoA family protein [Roseibacillus persicicus]|uniref:Uncharacterized protein n=1 Tax=Roseibacillus persicicus TaxID=454148 RepID=A0A918WQ12_9BACT|nr:PmoA family protein [Roseibacillus persicicus]GHC66875.1 hypothetical protein GCM10007100_38530 [Roseibacillus persicicus]
MKSIFYNAIALLGGWSGLARGYQIETVSFPEGVPVEVGAIEFAATGELYVALRRGDIFVATPKEDPTEFEWRLFASGFHNPCGIHVVSPGHLYIAQMAELTEVIDDDQDGVADRYVALSTEIGLSGNYHETMDLCPDGEGGLYLAPGTASHNGPTFTTTRGEFADSGRLGRNYSSVKWRGWILHWQRGKELEPVSSGYRMPNGIERSPKGEIWCGDNEGDWRASSPVYHVTPDTFAGHPSSLVWDSRFEGIENPLRLPRLLLDDLWNKPAFQLPRNMINSCAEPTFIPEDGALRDFAGQMLMPDQSGERILRLMPEWVDGNYQGAATFFIAGAGLNRGNNRLAFSPEGDALYVGQTGRGWGKLSEGLQRVSFGKQESFEVRRCGLQEDGFEVLFTQALEEVSAITIERYRYSYGYRYGGEEIDKVELSPKVIRKEENVLHLGLSKDELLPNHVYRINLKAVTSEEGQRFDNELVYNLNRLQRPRGEVEATVAVEKGEKAKFRVEVGGELFTEYLTEGFSNPILYPIFNERGQGMTRDWPVTLEGRAGESHDHPHHKSLFIGHEDINGVDFWHDTREGDGRIEHARTIETRGGEGRALIRTFNLWKDAEGEVICSDTREMKFGELDGVRYLDLELNVHASHGELVFAEKKDGVVGLRTHPDLRLTAAPEVGVDEVFGQAENSEGVTGKEVWGKKANWVHYWGEIDGQAGGVAILAHPESAREPTWWHARDYGLVSANPFGPVKEGGDGELTLPEGESLTLRYRFLFHGREKEQIDISKFYAAYCAEPIPPRTVCLAIPEQAPLISTEEETDVIPRGGVIARVNRQVRGQAPSDVVVKSHGLVTGEKIYADRDYRYRKIPEFIVGGDVMVSHNDDKRGDKEANYTVTLGQPGMLYLLVDERLEGKLDWMDREALKFEKTNHRVETDGDFNFLVYEAEADPGEYLLGKQTGASFYTLVAVNRD